MLINLNEAFPEAADGSRSPLPKQQDFLDALLRDDTAKYVAYVGGIGSGKTLIGCIGMLTLAVLFPGDYLIARAFMPELKITTLKTFLEICPKELIHEYRVADGIVRIKSQGGRISNIIFRQLDEVDKLRSLNLNAWYIDEASQCSEAAFMLLQGRLRGKYVRKGFITSNPNGHDWIYLWFVKQDHFKTATAKKAYRLIKAPSTENIHLPEGYVQSMVEAWSEDRVRREIYGDFDSFEGQVYQEFRRDVHVIKPFAIPDTWTRVIGADHGYRNPACWLWGAVDYDDNVYIYREFYQREWLIEEICKGHQKTKEPGVLRLNGKENISHMVIDPSVTAHRGQTGASDYDTYVEHLPSGFPISLANNDVTSGIDRVKTFLKQNVRTGKPRLFIFDTCANLIEEFSKYRYQELPSQRIGKVAEKETPGKVDDHAMDALRYLIMTRPEPPKVEDDIWKRIGYNTLEGSLHRELESVRKPKSAADPFEA